MSGGDKLHGFFVVLWILSANCEKLEDGCGYSLLGPDSGVLSSKNYPGTYPNNTWCEWHITAPEGSQLALRFADLDIEAKDCRSDFVKILKGGYREEKVFQDCGSLKSNRREVLVDTNQLVVQFRSGTHISGRGFLLAYSTQDHRELLTCLDKGSHFSEATFRKYCPAGCRGVPGDVSGDVSQGYRHTSVLCKAAVHAGVIQDETGGWVAVETHKGLSHYPATRANKVQSRDGSLSEACFTFLLSECPKPSILGPVSVNASSRRQRPSDVGHPSNWAAPRSPGSNSSSSYPQEQDEGPGWGEGQTVGPPWVSDQDDGPQWLQLDLGERKRITGIVTMGTTWLQTDCYVKSYKVEVKEREKSRWRALTQNNSSEHMVFEGNQDSLHQTRNTFPPPVVTRYLRVVPLAWHQHICLRVALLGCAHTKPNVTPLVVLPPQTGTPAERDEITAPVPLHADLVKLAIIIVPTVVSAVLLFVGICMFKIWHKKKSKEQGYGSTVEQKTGCWKQIKQPFARQQSTEFTITYSPEKDPVKLDLVPSNMAEYQQPLIGMGTVSRKGSTFRPIDMDSPKDDPSDPATHYDYLHTANQYALPLTNQEPEYATPIIERHAFRKDSFLPDPGSYSVPGAVLNKSPSFRASEAGLRKPGAGGSGGYQTPQVNKTERMGQNSEGVYDCPKVSPTQRLDNGYSDYQRPQAKPVVLESYATPRDSLKRSPASTLTAGACRPDPEGSSGGT